MLLSETVKVKWNATNKKWYESKGYIYTKMGDEFEVKVEDLTRWSKVLVKVKCDGCGKILEDIIWTNYLKCKRQDRKYYCQKCSTKLFGKQKANATKLKNSKTFEQWCIDNNRYDILKRWDYKLNDCSPKGISYGSNKNYYFKCPRGIHESELKNIGHFTNGQEGSMYCNQCNSFEQWCIDNNKQDILELWDYKLNKILPSEVSYGSGKDIYFKCPKGAHKSEIKKLKFITNPSFKFQCNQCNSFEQWCYDNLSKKETDGILNRWDYEKNKCKPNEISYGSSKKYWFKCSKGIHESELKNIKSFTHGQKGSIYCKRCNSFAQWGIDNLGEDFLDKYWDYDKNKVSPWEINCGSSSKKIWVKCQEKDYHENYQISCRDFKRGNRCAYCTNRNGRVHPLDSLGTLYPDVLNIWSEKNKKSPYEYAPKSKQKVWWKCHEGKHEDYYRRIYETYDADFCCPECSNYKGEIRISEYLIKHNFTKNIGYIYQKEFDGLIGLGNGNLSYDFYLPKYNLLIEYQGEFHDGTARNQAKVDFEKQQEHDRRKKQYAIDNDIKLLEIWYWDYDNIEKILDKELI